MHLNTSLLYGTLSLVLIVGGTAVVSGVDLQGSTLEAVSGKAIPWVRVELATPSGTLYANALSDTNGIYRIANVTNGTFVISFRRNGFAINPKSKDLEVKKNSPLVQNAVLYPIEPDDRFIVALAKQMKQAAKLDETIEDGYKRQWKALDGISLSQQVKRRLAGELQIQDKRVAEVPEITSWIEPVSEEEKSSELPKIDTFHPKGVDDDKIKSSETYQNPVIRIGPEVQKRLPD